MKKQLNSAIMLFNQTRLVIFNMELKVMHQINLQEQFRVRCLNRFQEAIEFCNYALQLNPNYAFALSTKGESLILKHINRKLRQLGCEQDAIECCNQSIKLNPNYYFSHLTKGNQNNNFRECLIHFDFKMKIYNQSRYYQALKCFNKVISLNQQISNIFLFKGHALDLHQRNKSLILKINRYEEAIDCYDLQLEQNSSDPFTLCFKGQALNIFFDNLQYYCQTNINKLSYAVIKHFNWMNNTLQQYKLNNKHQAKFLIFLRISKFNNCDMTQDRLKEGNPQQNSADQQ